MPANLAAYISVVMDALEQHPFCVPTSIATHAAGRLWRLWNGSTKSGGGTDWLLCGIFRPLHDDPRFLPLCHQLGLCTFWASSNLWPDFIEEAEDSAALQVRVRELAGAGQ